MSRLDGHELLIGVTGGIAAYKTAEVVSKLVQTGAGVTVIMTEAAQRFVQPITFEALSGRPVYTSMWQARHSPQGEHIALARQAKLLAIAPATANIIAKLACGLADDLLSTTALSVTCPVVIAPAMNVEMWNKPVVQHNVHRLEEMGVHRVGPEEGRLACGTEGAGRMAEPADLLQRIAELLAPQS